MYKSDFEIKKELCEIGRRIYNDGFVFIIHHISLVVKTFFCVFVLFTAQTNCKLISLTVHYYFITKHLYFASLLRNILHNKTYYFFRFINNIQS